MPRADAVENRDRILRVAHDAFAESATTSLNEIAKRAGVGPGTLYRHFPTREDLLLAVYRHDVQQLVDSVAAVLEASASPLDAFRAWFFTLASYVRVKHGLGEALSSAAAQHAIAETTGPVTAAIGQLLDACVAAGQIPPGHAPSDVLLAMSFLWRTDDDAQAHRITELVVAGLRRG